MKKIAIEDVRKSLANMGNTYVSLLTDEELDSALLQDDLGLEDYEVADLIERLEKVGAFFIAEVAENFLKNTTSVPIYLLRRICNDYVYESKPCVS